MTMFVFAWTLPWALKGVVFVTVGPSSRAGEDANPAAAAQLAATLDARFADWYYVISGADFASLRLKK